jgi:hypothetical protein
MRQVRFSPNMLVDEDDRKWFARWLWRARKATRAAIEQVEEGQIVTFNSSVWSDLKQFLLDKRFLKKCAYCESRVTTTGFGDAEHYRPKRGVTDEEGKVVLCDGQPHRGYYWLAYDWRNLLPACSQCNGGEGKMNQFPIASGKVHVNSHKTCRLPRALDALEEPLLLHPYFHDPKKFLRFGEDGTIAAAPGDKSGMGDASIRTYNLNRGDLDIPRKEYQEMAWNAFLKALSNDTPIAGALEKYRNGTSPYSLACLHYVQLKYEQRRQEIESGS